MRLMFKRQCLDGLTEPQMAVMTITKAGFEVTVEEVKTLCGERQPRCSRYLPPMIMTAFFIIGLELTSSHRLDPT